MVQFLVIPMQEFPIYVHEVKSLLDVEIEDDIAKKDKEDLTRSRESNSLSPPRKGKKI